MNASIRTRLLHHVSPPFSKDGVMEEQVWSIGTGSCTHKRFEGEKTNPKYLEEHHTYTNCLSKTFNFKGTHGRLSRSFLRHGSRLELYALSSINHTHIHCLHALQVASVEKYSYNLGSASITQLSQLHLTQQWLHQSASQTASVIVHVCKPPFLVRKDNVNSIKLSHSE